MKLITNGETVAVTGIPTIGGGTVRIPLEAASEIRTRWVPFNQNGTAADSKD